MNKNPSAKIINNLDYGCTAHALAHAHERSNEREQYTPNLDKIQSLFRLKT